MKDKSPNLVFAPYRGLFHRTISVAYVIVITSASNGQGHGFSDDVIHWSAVDDILCILKNAEIALY